jgi:hypothetical protein
VVKRDRTEQMASRWAANLSTVPSVLGRLSILSSLRDLNTGWYVHYGLEPELGEATHDFLLKSHEELFVQWQSMTVDLQIRDLQTHLRHVARSAGGFGRERNRNARIAHVLNTWTVTLPYRDFAPFSASTRERDRFLENMGMMVRILRNKGSEARSARPGPD